MGKKRVTVDMGLRWRLGTQEGLIGVKGIGEWGNVGTWERGGTAWMERKQWQ